jgi:L-fuconolactonase
MKIDAHQHFWKYDAQAYPWLDDSMRALQRDFLPEHLKPLLDAAGVDRTIAVQASQTLDETQWLLELADAHSWISGVIGWVDLQSDAVDAQLETIAGRPKLLGIRHVVQAEAPGFLEGHAFRRGVARLERHGLTYDVLIYARQLAEAADFARALPDGRFVVDHLAKPDIRGGGFDAWRTGLAALAGLPHVWCKLSGLVTEADWRAWTPEQLRPYIDTAVELFGPDRLMFGSDWPVCTVAAGYARTLAVVEEALDACSAAERARIFGGTAQELWKI